MTEAIDEYIAHKQVSGDRPLQPQSAATLRFRLHGMFSAEFDRLVGDLTPKLCEGLYVALKDKPRQANDTHRNTLAASKAFLAWAMTKGYAARNPMAEVKGEGRRHVGKEQLTGDEARKFIKTAVKLAKKGDRGALAAVTCLVAAIRASECAAILARDIDDGGRTLIIPKSKTAAGVRRFVIPKWLGVALKAAANERGQVFPEVTRYWVYYHAKRICRVAGVPEVCAHALRGTHSTLAIDHGASAEVVAKALGHTNVRITQRHYTKAEATDAARSRRAQAAMKERK